MSEVNEELTLESVWSDTPQTTESAEETVETTEETTEKVTGAEETTVEESAEETEQEATEEKTEDSPPESEEEKSEPWYIYKAMDEKNKRQKLEEELKALKAEKEPKEKTSLFDDEEKARSEDKTELREEFSREIMKVKEEAAMEVHGKDKVEQATTWFNEVATTPAGFALLKRFHDSNNSIFEVVKMHGEFEEFSGMKDTASYRDKIKAEIREELKAEFEKAKSSESEKKESITPSLASQTSSPEKGAVDDDLSLEGVWKGR